MNRGKAGRNCCFTKEKLSSPPFLRRRSRCRAIAATGFAENPENLPGHRPFFRTQETPLKRPIDSRLKRLFSKNTNYLEEFCRASTPFPREPFRPGSDQTALLRRMDHKNGYVPEGCPGTEVPSEREGKSDQEQRMP